MAELTLMKNAAEQQLAAEWQAAKAQAAGRRAAARGRVRALRRGRPAASARRGMEIHRPARADARRKAAREPARCRREGARRRTRARCSRDVECRRLVFVDGIFAPELSDLAALEPGLTIRPMAQALAQRRRASSNTHLGKVVRDRRRGGRAQHRVHGRRRRDPCRGRRRDRAADPSAYSPRPATSRRRCSRARSSSSRRARAPCSSRATKGPAGRDYQVNTALELVVADDAHVDHIKITREGDKALHVSSLMADVGAHARFNTFRVHHRRRGDAQPAVPALRRRRHDREHPRREPAQGPPACRHHAGGRSRGGRLPEPRGVQDRARRREPRHVPGQDHRAAAARRRPTPRWPRTR